MRPVRRAAELGALDRFTRMTRKRITILLLVLSLALTAIFIISSFVDYAPTISAHDMQNIYLTHITRFGGAIVLLQLACLVIVLTDRRRPNAA